VTTAIVLLSGGLDSATALAMSRAEGKICHALSFRYGQRHEVELLAAAQVAAALGAASHRVLTIDVAALRGSSLTGDGEIPKGRAEREIAQGIPSTYVPARNTLFVAHALAVAEALAADEVVLGINALDYSGYPDCRPEYLQAFQHMADLATKAGVEGQSVKVLAPLLHMGKVDIVKAALANRAPIRHTWSCYRGGTKACGTCESCALRLKGFAQAGAADPVPYATAKPRSRET
jgi:7-cyano-7-deazaguanine synthase